MSSTDDPINKSLRESHESSHLLQSPRDIDLTLTSEIKLEVPNVISTLSHEDEINQLFDDATQPASGDLKSTVKTEDKPQEQLHEDDPKAVPLISPIDESKTASTSISPNLFPADGKQTPTNQKELRRKSTFVPVTSDTKIMDVSEEDNSRISAYARLDFDNFTFFVQTLQVVLGRKSNDESLQQNVDVHLSSKKAISRRHAKIFYNFGSQRFEITILGRNGAFVDNVFVGKGLTVPLKDGTKIQIGDIPFQFVLPPSSESNKEREFESSSKQFNPSDAINLKSNLYSATPTPKASPKKKSVDDSKSKLKTEPPLAKAKPTSRKSSASNQATAKSISPKSSTTTTKAATDSAISATPAPAPAPSTPTPTTTTTPTPTNTTTSTTAARKNSIQRRNSLLKIRRLSNARRKSLAANDEINELLKDLGVTSIDAINEENSDLLDAQIQSLLDEDSENLGGLEDSLMKLAEFNESAIDDGDDEEEDPNKSTAADTTTTTATNSTTKNNNNNNSSNNNNDNHEFDRLVKGIEHDALDDEIKDIDASLSLLNQEIAQLEPLIDEHNQGLMREKEEKKKQLEEQKRKKQLQQLQRKNTLAKLPLRSAPLMGKPASIQPPASSSIYSRINGLDKIGKIIPPRQPPPKLVAPVLLITSEPSAIRSRPPLRAITVSDASYLATFSYPKTIEEPSKYPKPKLKKEPHKKSSKKVYTTDEIPTQYRSKPNINFQTMITNVLKTEAARNGLTISEITEAIREVYPYYKYCPDGWQFSVNHCIKFTKIYKRLLKRGNEWLYAMDELYINERENIRIKQRELAQARAKAEAMRQEEIRQRQRLEAQKSLSHNIVGRNFALPYPNTRVPSNQYGQYVAGSATGTSNQGYGTGTTAGTSGGQKTIKAQLAAVRGNTNSSSSKQTLPGLPSMDDPRTQKSLVYLRKELFTLYKARKLTYDLPTATSLITKAVATTIAQVNSIGAKRGAGDNALGYLVEQAPQQVSKILGIALNNAIKEHEGHSSGPSSRSATPASKSTTSISKVSTPAPAPASAPVVTPTSTTAPVPAKITQPAAPIVTPAVKSTTPAKIPTTTATPPSISASPVVVKTEPKSPAPQPPASSTTTKSSPTAAVVASPPAPPSTKETIKSPPTTATTTTTTPTVPAPAPAPAPVQKPKPTPPTNLPRPLFGKPPGLKPGASLGRPLAFGKPPSAAGGGFSRAAPTFLSNKPSFQSTKRELESDDSEKATKIQKTE